MNKCCATLSDNHHWALWSIYII